MVGRLPGGRQNTVRVSIIVEGPSDEIVLSGQRSWLESLGLEVSIHPTGGRPSMIKKARQYCKMANNTGCERLVFLPDQDTDECAMRTRQRLDVDSVNGAVTIVMKRKLEAWILADGECMHECIGTSYRPAGQTDTEADCKTKLKNMIKRKKGYEPTSIEAARMVAPHFSVPRAAKNNTSAKRFKDFVESIGHGLCDRIGNSPCC